MMCGAWSPRGVQHLQQQSHGPLMRPNVISPFGMRIMTCLQRLHIMSIGSFAIELWWTLCTIVRIEDPLEPCAMSDVNLNVFMLRPPASNARAKCERFAHCSS